MIEAFVIFWIICGVFAYAGTLAHFQRKYASIASLHYREDVAFAVFLGVMGPLGLISTAFASGFFAYGLKFK